MKKGMKCFWRNVLAIAVGGISLAGCRAVSNYAFQEAPHSALDRTPAAQPSPEPTEARGCDCPAGYTVTPAEDGCLKQTVAPVNSGTSPVSIVPGDIAGVYGMSGNYYADADGNANWPLVSNDWSPTVDSTGKILAHTYVGSPSMIDFWMNRLNGSGRVTIKASPQQNRVWYSKAFCIDIPQSKKYVIGVGGDNYWQLKMDGVDYERCTSVQCFKQGHFLGQTLSSGKHLIEFKYRNEGSHAAGWFEVFENSLDEMKTITKEEDLKIVYSTRALVGGYWDAMGDACPAGYTYDACNPHGRQCVKLERVACQ